MDDGLIIFARYPRLGRVKTRLNPTLTPAQSLTLYQAFLDDILEETTQVAAQRHLYLADCSTEEMAEWRKRPLLSGVSLHHQQGCDLGQRMWHAYQEVSRQTRRVVFIGSDSPHLPTEWISSAFRHIQRYPVAIGPVDDGGYYLLGLSQPRPELFEGIDWGSRHVFRQTVEKLQKEEFALLPQWYDLDTPADLERLRRSMEQGADGPARTGRWLRGI